MMVSVVSTIAVRLFLSWLLGIVLHMGVIGIAIAIVWDLVFRAVIFSCGRSPENGKAFR